MNEKPRYWAIKTTEGGSGQNDHWREFLDEQVVAVGWKPVKINPDQFRDRRNQFIDKVVDRYGRTLRAGGSSPGYAARTIYKFANEWREGDVALICAGYRPNQTKPVRIYGIARVGAFFFDRHLKWWAFKREAEITPIDEYVAVRHLIPIFGESMRLTIHPRSEAQFRRFCKLKQIGQHLSLSAGLEERIAEMAEKDKAESSGQGFHVTAELRKRIESLAVKRATEYFQSRGFSVKNVGTTRSYDLECQKGKRMLRVEVKGTQTDGTSVILTPNEVLNAKRFPTALFLLHSIQCRKIGRSAVPTGGESFVLNRWQVEAHGQLKPLSYTYEILLQA